MRLHRDVDPESHCGGQVADGQELFRTDYWCVYCGAKWNDTATIAKADRQLRKQLEAIEDPKLRKECLDAL